MGRPIRTFTVLPHLPERLQSLQKLAYNMWWCWNYEATALFRRIDQDAFEALDQSPVKLLGAVSQTRLVELLDDDGFLAHMDRVEEAFDNYMNAATWYHETYASGHSAANGTPAVAALPADFTIAYFSAEFGLHESVPVYSGGLGVLSGDHLKSASDLGLPLVGVGLMYREGYFRQYLTVDGWQQERYPENDFFNLPLIPEAQEDGTPLLVGVPFPGREVRAGRPCAALPTRHQHPAELGGRPNYHGPTLRRRRGYAHSPGNDPGRRRRPSLARVRQAADCLPYERGP